jgi:broad specificity phosphatase PhoE
MLLVRHGQTEANRRGVYAGWSDEPLDEAGRLQAAAVASRLAAVPLQAVYSSPLRRAVQTAEPLARSASLEIHLLEELAELRMPGWQGLNESELASRFPVEWAAWIRNPAALECSHVESLSSLARRVRPALAGIGRRHRGQSVAIISHEAVLRVGILSALGLELRSYRRLYVPPGSLSILRWSPDGATLALLGDTSHYDGGRLGFLAQA